MNGIMNNQMFLVRVYGLLVHENRLLLSDELHHGRSITKFPGGGLEFGEGTVDCLIREFMEELGIAIRVMQHFYTTDFFQPSAFDTTQQVISIYYHVTAEQAGSIAVTDKLFDFDPEKNITQQFRWVDRLKITSDEVTFPIDKKVVSLLQESIRA